MSSEEVSISSDTMPSVHTPAGMFRQAARLGTVAFGCAGLLAKVERGRQIARARPHARQRLKSETQRDEFDDRRRIVVCVIDVASLGVGRNDDCGNTRTGPPAITL